ncbi:DNA cytosine methyltransferase [Herbaspirillum sp. C9C3]|uniref:DNA cytosine methyltransferase n=1 Tax=Herbaspirillum sp. C9C3 TaxID=2735271 RepID=UPI001585169D|nr:DNA cytosine methyltransferase [Herbaspirillum sp. C9C3]NUT62724.1 DNA cytosine methyltransferase [Herbaspirillum sp. C9C3]
MSLNHCVHRPKAASLFSSAGIGELGIEAAGLDIVLANELLPSRAALYRANFQHEMLEGDISEVRDQFIEQTRAQLVGDELFLLYATPPCQGMSSNGMGKLKAEVASGRRHEEDQRNRLIIPAMDVAVALKPRWLLLENVPGMETTEIRTNGKRWENIISYVRRRLGQDYVGGPQVIACDDFGVPQRRKRLITIFTRDAHAKQFYENNDGSFFPTEMREPRVTLRDAIGSAPPLDAKAGQNEARWFHPYHYVPVMAELKYHWVQHTKEGNTAFNNQCINPACGSTNNPGHRDVQIDGKWVSSKEIPIHCLKCGHLLPRPHVLENGKARLLRGFHSAYRRMKWDETARTLTQNFIYEASDNKIHPTQNRVLSIYEAMVLQTIDRYEYVFQVNGKDISTAQIAEVIGESVPPYLIEKICRMMLVASSVKSGELEKRGEISKPLKAA